MPREWNVAATDISKWPHGPALEDAQSERLAGHPSVLRTSLPSLEGLKLFPANLIRADLLGRDGLPVLVLSPNLREFSRDLVALVRLSPFGGLGLGRPLLASQSLFGHVHLLLEGHAVRYSRDPVDQRAVLGARPRRPKHTTLIALATARRS